MSIPPLVCSTPPPPDQCDDDKDTEDYDIRYNLSQDEDEDSNEYDYGNFSSYNSFKTVADISNNIELPKIATEHIEINESPTNELHSELNTSHFTNNNNTKIEDDVLEDLDLKLDRVSINSGKVIQVEENQSELGEYQSGGSLKEIDRVSINSRKISQVEENQSELEENQSGCSLKETNNDIDKIFNEAKVIDDGFQSLVANVPQDDPVLDKEVIEVPDDTNKVVLPQKTEENDFSNEVIPVEPNVVFQCPTTKHMENDELLKDEGIFQLPLQDIKACGNLSDDDDFGDFDDFKFASSDVQTTSIDDNCDHPWGNDENRSNFQANFGELEPQNVETKFQASNENKPIELEVEDDFGDFDDFKSSSVEQNASESNNSPVHEVSMISLQSTEHIEKSLNSIFEYDISDTDTQFAGKLESSLCETWGHLMEIEVRQPYMINWNNSLGQKTLLKALCIDSRNILFGPKWAHNMPKYAANLSAAPLQPQKPLVSSTFSQNEVTNPEKPSSKPADSWVDPFTADGKESCSVEGGKSTPQPRPTDLDVFEASMPMKSDGIYSAIPTVQPLRQISLPDTHIFTPTDSETPRSKTIHYDSGAPVLIPQSATIDDEYSDFQDFKASVNTTPKPSEAVTEARNRDDQTSSISKPSESSTTFQTSVLQPIKIEPIMPTLNWPDPGQVKETFDDFSDFISNSSWPSEKQEVPLANDASKRKKSEPTSMNISESLTCDSIRQASEEKAVKASNSYDDDFDTFQSAEPTVESIRKDLGNMTIPPFNNFKSTIQDVVEPSPNTSKAMGDFDIAFSTFDNLNDLKQSNISHTRLPVNQNEFLPFSQTSIPNNVKSKLETPHSFRNSPTHHQTTAQVLQPTPAISSAAQSKAPSGQILQPLSLEGFSQINWPNPGSLDLQDLSRFNPVETLPSLKNDVSSGGHSKNASPAHSIKSKVSDDDWGDFVSSRPKQPPPPTKVQPTFADDDEWTDFVSSPTVQPQNGLNTISLNVHTNLNMQKSAHPNKYKVGSNQLPLDIPSLNYVTPKTNHHRNYSDRHFQNL